MIVRSSMWFSNSTVGELTLLVSKAETNTFVSKTA